MKKDFRNKESYYDPTAGRVFYDDARRRKARFLIRIILFITWEAGFRVTNRIELEDRQTGRTY